MFPFDTAGAELTGGYIIKIDKLTGSGGAGWTSAFAPPGASGNQTVYFQFAYPNPDSIHVRQAQYIQSFTDSFEAALASPQFQDPVNGWRRFMDENSVIDFMLMNEMSRNVDGYRISTFLHKEKITQGNKLKMGPVWDFDIAWQNANYCQGSNTAGWAYDFNSVCGGDGLLVPFWWQRFRQDTLFNKRLFCRYTEFRSSVFSDASLNALADSMAAVLAESQARNFERWPILGVYVWPNPGPIPATYAGEITKLKQWFANRMAWLDAQISPIASPYPLINLGPDTAICQGEAVALNPGAGVSVWWSTGQTDPILYASDPGTFWAEVRNLYGCKASDTIYIAVNPNPHVDFTVSPISNFQFQFNSLSDAGTAHVWHFGDGNTSSQINPVHTYAQAGSYTVELTVTDANGCTSSFAQTVQTQTAGLESVSENRPEVFPNPTEGPVTLSCLSCTGGSVTLFSADGREVLNMDIVSDTFQFDISGLPSGLYLLKINSPDAYTGAVPIIKR
jgi:hypothetical protein